MKHHIIFLLFYFSFLVAQLEENPEFQINTITGVLTNEATGKPIFEGKVEIFSGNSLSKGVTYSNEDGHFTLRHVGYVWRPRLVISSDDYESTQFSISQSELDNYSTLEIPIQLTSIPDHRKIPSIVVTSIAQRAEMFFRKGNVFYYLSRSGKNFISERIIIHTFDVINKIDGNLVIHVNGQLYDPLGCYVPQLGQYENLAMILDEYFPKSIFKSSGYPMFLSNSHLEPSEIFGTVINLASGKPVFGADVQIEGMALHRITTQDGKFRFKVRQPGHYKILVHPPLNSGLNHVSQNKIIVKRGKGGWYKSNQYLLSE